MVKLYKKEKWVKEYKIKEIYGFVLGQDGLLHIQDINNEIFLCPEGLFRVIFRYPNISPLEHTTISLDF